MNILVAVGKDRVNPALVFTSAVAVSRVKGNREGNSADSDRAVIFRVAIT